MSENQVSRHSLIAGIALVALNGLRDRTIQEYRHLNKDGGWGQQPKIKHIDELSAALNQNKDLHTKDREVLDVLAYARQTARVSFEEWEAVVRIRKTDA